MSGYSSRLGDFAERLDKAIETDFASLVKVDQLSRSVAEVTSNFQLWSLIGHLDKNCIFIVFTSNGMNPYDIVCNVMRKKFELNTYKLLGEFPDPDAIMGHPNHIVEFMM